MVTGKVHFKALGGLRLGVNDISKKKGGFMGLKMKNMIAAALLLAGFSGQALADEKSVTIGLGSYVTTLEAAGESWVYAGDALVITGNFTENVSLATHFYSASLGNEIISGSDTALRFGKHGDGFTYFAAVGMYSEKLSSSDGLSLSVFGSTFGLGMGYNWTDVALTWEGYSRSAGDYTKRAGLEVTQTSSSLNVSYRF